MHDKDIRDVDNALLARIGEMTKARNRLSEQCDAVDYYIKQLADMPKSIASYKGRVTAALKTGDESKIDWAESRLADAYENEARLQANLVEANDKLAEVRNAIIKDFALAV